MTMRVRGAASAPPPTSTETACEEFHSRDILIPFFFCPLIRAHFMKTLRAAAAAALRPYWIIKHVVKTLHIHK